MKTSIVYSWIIVLMLVLSCKENVSPDDKTSPVETIAVATNGSNRIEVIDFYSTHRCKTCLKIENNAKVLVDTAFQDETKNGIVSFRTVNVDDKANYDMAERFEAAGTALYINVIKNGAENHINMTDFAFMKAFDDQEFADELKAEIDEQLKTL